MAEAENEVINPQLTDRTIRVFISSTFRDMMRERDLLVKEVFPELRRKCAKRFVTLTEVDLRWGITEAQANEGQVLPLCLAEIQRSRPYFIGLLGERYGWIPDTIRPEVIEREPWLREHVQGHTSVTELEILYGVLNNQEMRGHAFFYFRDPSYVNDPTLTDDEHWDMVERDIPADVDKYGGAEAKRRTEEREAKLIILKQRIRDSKLPLVETYTNPKALSDIVLHQFDELIDRLYPEEHVPDRLSQERMAHNAYAKNKVFACIDRPVHLAVLNAYAAPAEYSGKGLVVTGESGVGKTALLAAWARDWAKNHPKDFLFQHYFGATPDSASPDSFLRRLLDELKERFGIQDDVPNDPEKLRDTLSDWLAHSVGKGCTVLVLDGLNQVQGSEPDCRLNFLPRHFPPHVVVLGSTLPGLALDVLKERGWTEHYLPQASEVEVDAMVTAYLRIHARTLEPGLRHELITAPGAKNPLFLRTLLEELRQFGSFERLPQRIHYYLEADNPKDLFRRVLIRWQDDFDGKDPEQDKPKMDLVRCTLTHLWAARQGLSEAEWLDLLGDGSQPMPRLFWTPLFLALEPHLSQHTGLFAFAHEYLRQAVDAAFVPSSDLQKIAHQRLGGYFDSQKTITTRTLEERPWQWWKGQKWDKLYETLLDFDFFVALRDHGESTINYWASLPEQFNPTNSYFDALMKLLEHHPRGMRELKIVSELANFFLYFQRMNAEPLLNEAVKIADQILSNTNVADYVHIDKALLNSYSAHARFLRDTNQIEEAEAAFRRVVTVAEKYFYNDQKVIALSLSELAWLLVLTKQLPEAEILIHRSITILEEQENSDSIKLAYSLSVLGQLFQRENNLEEAEKNLTKALDITEKILGHNHPNVAQCLSNLGGVLHAIGKFPEAENSFRRALNILDSEGDRESVTLAVAFNNLAQLLQQLKRYAEAEPLSRKQVEILHHWGAKVGYDHPYLQASVSNYAEILQKMGYTNQMINTQLGKILLSATTLIGKGQVLRD